MRRCVSARGQMWWGQQHGSCIILQRLMHCCPACHQLGCISPGSTRFYKCPELDELLGKFGMEIFTRLFYANLVNVFRIRSEKAKRTMNKTKMKQQQTRLKVAEAGGIWRESRRARARASRASDVIERSIRTVIAAHDRRRFWQNFHRNGSARHAWMHAHGL